MEKTVEKEDSIMNWFAFGGLLMILIAFVFIMIDYFGFIGGIVGVLPIGFFALFLLKGSDKEVDVILDELIKHKEEVVKAITSKELLDLLKVNAELNKKVKQRYHEYNTLYYSLDDSYGMLKGKLYLLRDKKLPDIYDGELNTERITAYRKLLDEWNIGETVAREIFCKGADWYKSIQEREVKVG